MVDAVICITRGMLVKFICARTMCLKRVYIFVDYLAVSGIVIILAIILFMF